MLFPSLPFLLFFLPLLLILYYTVCRGTQHRQNILLLIASLFFYSWGEPLFVFAMLLCVVINWCFGYVFPLLAGHTRLGRAAFILTVAADISLLALFKYAGFITENLNYILPVDLPVPSISLPIGISFFTFQALSYTIDVYRGTVKAQKKLSYVALYISLFPQLIAGPIIRYSTIERELESRRFSWSDFESGFTRFITGLGKKVIIANVIALAADFAFEQNSASLSVAAAWLGAAAYALQIYFDFSGYSDMAIGLGRMFGFHFLENFNYPYISRSISEFWRRWHISLSSWFRDYVYFPLGGSRVSSKLRLVFNLFVVWALTGLWHGANWTFVIWGLMFFVLITVEKITGFGKLIEKLPLIRRVYVLGPVLISWVFFRSPDLGFALTYLQSMFGRGGNPLTGWDATWLVTDFALTWVLGIIGCMPVVRWFKSQPSSMPILKWMFLIFVAVLSLAFIHGSNYNPFIYFNF